MSGVWQRLSGSRLPWESRRWRTISRACANGLPQSGHGHQSPRATYL